MNSDSVSNMNSENDRDKNGFLRILSTRRDSLLWVWIWLFGIMGPGYLQGNNLETSPTLAGDTLESKKSVVWDIYGEYAVRRTKVHRESLRAMLDTGIRRLTGLADPNQAWHQFIRDDDVVALVFTRPGSKSLAMNTDVASVLLQSLYDCGFKPGQFMLVGLEEQPEEAKGTRPCSYGWKKDRVDFLTDSDHLAAWLDEVTAIINVPAIMDDNIIVLRGAMANLTLPMLKCPGRLYMNQGDPFVADIYNLPPIRHKVRLHIGIGLRILYHGGPEVHQVYIYEHGTLLFSTDPVALDQVALQLINRARHNLPLPEGAADTLQCSYLQTAQAMGLGHNDLNQIEYHLRDHNE
jgi:uncharacterized protein DUF362